MGNFKSEPLFFSLHSFFLSSSIIIIIIVDVMTMSLFEYTVKYNDVKLKYIYFNFQSLPTC